MSAITRGGKGAPLSAEDHDRNLRMGAGWATVAALLASAETGFHPGDVLRAGPHRYAVAGRGGPDPHLLTAGGVRLHVCPDAAGSADLRAFGAAAGQNTAVFLQRALEALRDGHFDRLRIPSGTWPLEASVEVSDMRDGCSVDATGARFTNTGTYSILRIRGGGEAATVATGNVPENATVLPVADGSIFAPGDMIDIQSDETATDGTVPRAAPHNLCDSNVVRGVSGGTVALDMTVLRSFTAEGSLANGGTGLITIRRYRPCLNFAWTGGVFDLDGAPGVHGLALERMLYPVLEDVTVSNATVGNFYFEALGYPRIVRCTSVRSASGGTAAFGYGIWFVRSVGVQVGECLARGPGRVGFEMAHGTRDATFTNCRSLGNENGFNQHPSVGIFRMVNCEVETSSPTGIGCAIDGTHCEVIGGRFRAPRFFRGSGTARTTRIVGVTCERIAGGTVPFYSGPQNAVPDEVAREMQVEGCVFRSAGGANAYCEIGNRGLVASLSVRNCEFVGLSAVLSARTVILAENNRVHGCTEPFAAVCEGRAGEGTRAFVRNPTFTGIHGVAGAQKWLLDLRHVEAHVHDLHSAMTTGAEFPQPPWAFYMPASAQGVPNAAAVHAYGCVFPNPQLAFRVPVAALRGCSALAGGAWALASGAAVGHESGSWFKAV